MDLQDLKVVYRVVTMVVNFRDIPRVKGAIDHIMLALIWSYVQNMK